MGMVEVNSNVGGATLEVRFTPSDASAVEAGSALEVALAGDLVSLKSLGGALFGVILDLVGDDFCGETESSLTPSFDRLLL